MAAAGDIAFTRSDGGEWCLRAEEIHELQASPGYAGKVDVEACLRDLARRQAKETRLRKPPEEMHGYIENWLGMELTKFRKFPAGSDERHGSRGPGKPAGGRPKGVEERALEMLRAL